MTGEVPRQVAAEDLPAALGEERRRLLLDLCRLWLRQCDLRFGQLLRLAAGAGFGRPGSLDDRVLADGIARALAETPERPVPAGPYWDTESRRHGSFIHGRPRDPMRIPQLIKTIGRAWPAHPELELGALIELALDRASVEQNDAGTRLLLIEDRPLERTLEALEADPWPSRSLADRSRVGITPNQTGRKPVTDPRPPTPGPAAPAAIIHAGAGAFGRGLRDNEDALQEWLMLALDNAKLMLELGHEALSAAKTAVQIMEDFPLFNAGYGSVLCDDGTVQMSAAVMRGADLQAGAVAGIRTVKHPIIAALTVLRSPSVLLVGPHADRHALERGAERRLNDYFITDHQRKRLRTRSGHERGGVGAVCLDTHGGLAAAASTGGVLGQPPGTVGDTPQIGAGIWADPRVAVCCAGATAAFTRVGAARHLATLVEIGTDLNEAAERTLDAVAALNGSGGVIAIDANGNTATPYSSQTLLHAIWRSGSDPVARIPRPAE